MTTNSETRTTNITLNGVCFTHEMLETLREWYSSDIKNDSLPRYFVDDLVCMQSFLIDQLAEVDADAQTRIAGLLNKTRWLIENLQPFVK